MLSSGWGSLGPSLTLWAHGQRARGGSGSGNLSGGLQVRGQVPWPQSAVDRLGFALRPVGQLKRTWREGSQPGGGGQFGDSSVASTPTLVR